MPWGPGAFGYFYYFFYGLMGALLGHWEKSETSITRLVGKISGLLFLAAFLWVLWQSGGALGDFIRETELYFNTLLKDMTTQVAQDADGNLSDQLALIQSYGDQIVYYSVRLIPGMVLATCIFVIWLNIVVARKLFLKDNFFEKIGPLRRWQLPFSFVWATIALTILLFSDIYFLKSGLLKIFTLNLFIIFALTYFFQGLAILAYYGQKWSIPPLVRLLGYLVFLLFFQPVGVLLLALGFFDSWFDFRKLAPKEAGS